MLALTLALLLALPSHDGAEPWRWLRLDAIVSAADEAVTEAGPIKGWTHDDTRTLLLAIAYHESGFARDVDVGPGTRPAACLTQIQIARGRPTREALTVGPDARVLCFRWALRLARGGCPGPREERLAAYASGRCDCAEGRQRSREIMSIFDRWHARLALAAKKE